MDKAKKSDKKIDKKKAIEILFRNANLDFLLDSNQKEIKDLILNKGRILNVIGSSRQIGKTYAMVVIAYEACLRTPNFKVVYLCPTIKMVKSAVLSKLSIINDICPKDLLPNLHKSDGILTFPNGSEIKFAGTENDSADRVRGSSANLVIWDEAGFSSADKFDYIFKSVLTPLTTSVKGSIVLISTPSPQPSHPFIEFIKKAEFEGTYVKKTIYDNPRLTEAEIQRLIDSCGGRDSNDFRREYMVEIIADTSSVVIPEFTKELQSRIVKEVEKPTHFDAYVGYDIGGTDNHALLLAYYDFNYGRLVIDDELVINGVTTDIIANELKIKENNSFNGRQPYLRIADNNNVQLIFDLAMKHQLNFLPAQKDNRDAAINNMRMLLKQEKIIINPRCINLINHLENVMWNKQKTGFVRSNVNHYDTVPALYYLLRMVDFQKSPYPADYINYDLIHVSPKNKEYKNFGGTRIEKQSNTAEAIETLFKGALGRIKRNRF